MTDDTTPKAAMVKEFMDAFDQTCYKNVTEVPCEVATLRAALIREEHAEYMKAKVRSADELDAIVDLLYVTLGTNLALGVPVQPYRSGQVRLASDKKFYVVHEVAEVVTDLDSKFPCAKIQNHALAALTQRLIDTGRQRGYDLNGAFAAVHKANMGKLWSEVEVTTAKKDHAKDGSIKLKEIKGVPYYLVRNSLGKIIKPPSFQAADLAAFINP